MTPKRFGRRAVFPRVKRKTHFGNHAKFPRVALIAGSHPVKGDEESDRRANCARYSNCLDHACGENWLAWSCAECSIVEIHEFRIAGNVRK
jgi:hypothetical protein